MPSETQNHGPHQSIERLGSATTKTLKMLSSPTLLSHRAHIRTPFQCWLNHIRQPPPYCERVPPVMWPGVHDGLRRLGFIYRIHIEDVLFPASGSRRDYLNAATVSIV